MEKHYLRDPFLSNFKIMLFVKQIV